MAVAPIMSLAATGLSAGGSMMGAIGQAQQDQFQAQQATNAAKYAQIQGAQRGTELTRNMQAMLGHIQAVRASVGSDVRSPTTAAIMGFQERKAEWERGVEEQGYMAQSANDLLSARMYRSAANTALIGGALGAGGSLFKGIGGAFG